MSNELTNLQNVVIDYTPARLKLLNKEPLNLVIDNFINKYNKLVVTEETLKEAKSAKAEVNALKRAFENKRKEQKKLYNLPLQEFENEIKSYVTKLDEVYQSINEGVTFFEEKQREERRQKVLAMINEVAVLNAVEPSTIELKNTWLRKTATRSKIIPEIVESVVKQKRIDEDVKKITEYCIRLNLPKRQYVALAQERGYWQKKQLILITKKCCLPSKKNVS